MSRFRKAERKQANLHVICTMRSKTDFVLTEEKGKQVPKKVGLAPVQREGFDYEMTVVLDIDRDTHMALTSKDRTRLFGDTPVKLAEGDGARLRDWLMSGKSVEDQIAEDVARLTDRLRGAAKEGTEAFTRMWQANRGPARDHIAADKKLMANLQAACAKADAADGDQQQQRQGQEEEQQRGAA